MTAVKKIWNDEENFCVLLVVDGISVQYAFSTKALETGASLSRLMNEEIKETLKHSGWAVPPDALKAAGKEGVAALRPTVEAFFEARGIGNG